MSYKALKSGTDVRGVASDLGGKEVNLTDTAVYDITSAFATFVAAHQIYIRTLVRRNKEMWSRTPKYENDEQKSMYEQGEQWQIAHNDCKKELHIINDGLNLYGEYYDFGNDKCAMVLTGRMDSLRYGYFFAKPYEESGYNLLFVDARAHGESDGKYQTLGFEESKDYLAWCRLMHDEYNMKSIVFHGICIGAAGGISDAAAVSQIGTYAALKYERRRLLSQKQDMTTGGTPS